MTDLDDMDLLGDVGVPLKPSGKPLRPKFSHSLMKEILRRVGRGETILMILNDPGMPEKRTWYQWVHDYGYWDEYQQVREDTYGIDEDKINTVIQRIASGETFKQIEQSDPTLPTRWRFNAWLKTNPDYMARYTAAQMLRSEHLVDEIDEIADNTENDYTVDRNGNPVVNNEAIARSKLRIETNKWTAAKFNPKFNERNTTELVGAEGSPLIPQSNDLDVARRVAFLLAQGAAQL